MAQSIYLQLTSVCPFAAGPVVSIDGEAKDKWTREINIEGDPDRPNPLLSLSRHRQFIGDAAPFRSLGIAIPAF
jgi:hypothetical protein